VRVITADAAVFEERAAPLLADEARHNLILGLLGTVRRHPSPATEADRPLLLRWLVEFSREARQDEQPDEERLAKIVQHRLDADEAGFVLWETDGATVSFAGYGGETPSGVRIGPVYTPPELRGRGYGTAVTDAVSAERLAAGRRFCFLYTDLSNPTSNSIYVKIGYRRACDSLEVDFVTRPN
jgi:uncharacterized protein